MIKASSILLKLGCFTFFSLFASSPAIAQDISADGTTNTNVASPDNSNFEINEGNRAGNNLYHSFGNFSVPDGGSANFNNAPDVENIINRVTGGSVSDINGLIKANGSANLFLINPAGIIFGENARLDIGGSFLGSTADSLSFIDGTEFSATNTQTKPLLTINAPIGLNLRDNPQPIANNSATGLEVKPNKNISLVGGNLDFDRGKLIAPGGKIELGSLTGVGRVGLSGDGSLNFPVGVQRGDITLNNGASVNVSAGGGGSIAVNANNLNMSGISSLEAGIAQNLGSITAQAGNINVDATSSVLLKDGSRISSNTDGDGNKVRINASDRIIVDGSQDDNRSSIATSVVGIGNAGNISITTNNLSLTNGGQISADNFKEGNGGNITINAGDRISVEGDGIGSFIGITSIIRNQKQDEVTGKITRPKAIGNAGDIFLTTKNLSVNNVAQVSASNLGEGNAGNVTIKDSDTVRIDGNNKNNGIFSGITSGTSGEGQGNAGVIDITTKNLDVTNAGQIGAGVFKTIGVGGNGGVIKINASNNITVDGRINEVPTSIGSGVGLNGKGNGGGIEITTKNLS
ncbi:MAG: filamentous hemagglutinin N-terminal domain-containing protein, partial [Xenococcaceae cyanobacterium]